MKSWANIFRIVILIIGIIVLSFDALLYNFFKQQRNGINALSDQQKIEVQVNGNKFKYQQDQIERINKDLDDARQQIKDQKDALLQEVEKRQQVEDESKSIQASLVDIKAEADAIKQDMKGWQKDYVSVLAELEKKMDDSQENINSLKTDIEKIVHPPDNDLPGTTPPAPEKKDKNGNQP